MRPEAAQYTSSALLGKSSRARTQPYFIVGGAWDEAKLFAIQGPQIFAVLDAVEEAASGQLREKAS